MSDSDNQEALRETLRRAGLPLQFGKSDDTFDAQRQIAGTAWAESSEYQEELTLGRQLPITNEVRLCGHRKRVSALALDPAGARLLSGSFDGALKMWDFAAMDTQFRSFRELEVEEGYPVNSVSYAPQGGTFLASTNSAQAKLYDRDGFAVAQCVKGDMYLVDMNATKGHIAQINHAVFSPTDPSLFVTASNDSTVRLWDPDRCEKTQTAVFKVYGKGRSKGAVSSVCMDGCGSLVCVPVCDGSLQVFPVRGPFHRPSQTVPAAFCKGDTVCSLCFVRGKETVVLRTLDGQMRLWDLRSTRQPLAARTDIAALYDGTEVITDPQRRFVVAGAANGRDRGSRLVFMDASTLATVREVEDSAVITSLLWHPKLNQLVVGLNDGSSKVLFDPTRSERGALLPLSRRRFKGEERLYDAPLVIVNPDTLPTKRERIEQARRDAEDPKKTHTPAIPSGPGTNGRLASNFTEQIIRQIGIKKFGDDDPAEALRRLGAAAAAHPRYFGSAYAKTQPETLFTDENEDDDDDDDEDDDDDNAASSGSNADGGAASAAKRLRRG